MGHALLAMVALSRTMTAPHASRVHLDGLVMQGYAANAHQAQSLPKGSSHASHVQQALPVLEVCAMSVRPVRSQTKLELAVRDVLSVPLAATAHAVRVWMDRSPTMHLSRLPACFVRPGLRAPPGYAQIAPLELSPTPTVHRAIFAQLADTVLPESSARLVPILSMRPAQHMAVSPTTL